MSIRLRRLQTDYDRICSLFTGKSRIKLVKTFGNPPDKYQFEYLVTGLEKDLETRKLKNRSNFTVEIVLTSAYPRMAPQCRMLTPVFHPNIAPHAVCIGDHWAAGESLAHLIVRIAEMISYQSYNTKSPLNGEAAKWCDHNKSKLPTDAFDFQALLVKGEKTGAVSEEGRVCANCGVTEDSNTALKECANGHLSCEECLLECGSCGAALCLKCQQLICANCNIRLCYHCAHKCRGCREIVCPDHRITCITCEGLFCEDCMVDCDVCGCGTCINDIKRVPDGDGHRLLCPACEGS
ncbi:ubiquitin-conjugating enzyme E2 [Planctomycetota bacterium]